MIQPLAAQMQYSIPSVRRFLSEVGYYSSFTHNGAWYTLRSIPRFGRNGLWFYRDIGFSRAGSLTKTLIALITRSSAGMSAEMLGETLRCRCHGVLVNLWRKGSIQREKIGRCQVYFAADPHRADRQRQAQSAQHSPRVQFSAEIAVLVLAEFIRSPDSSFEQLAEKISQKGDRASGTNRTPFRPTRSKKNDADCGARALEALACVLKQLSMDTSPGALFPDPPVIRFTPQEKECFCGTRLLVQKTRQKNVVKMTGPLIAHETVMQCPACGKVFGSQPTTVQNKLKTVFLDR